MDPEGPFGMCSEQWGQATPALLFPMSSLQPPKSEPEDVQGHQAGMAKSTPSELPGPAAPGITEAHWL